MIHIPAELLDLSGEPALLAKGGKILFANDAACALLGADCREKSLRALFGADIAETQAPSFVGEAEAAGKHVLLRVRAVEGMRVVFLSPSVPAQELIGDAFLYALRSELMQLGVSVSLIRQQLRPEEARSVSALRSVLQSLYRVKRTVQNLSIIRGTEAGTLFFNPQPLDLCALLRDLIAAVTLNLPQPEIRFTAPDNLPIQGDASLLEALTLNLLANCLCHAKGCTRIRVTLRGSGEQAILSVDDDGCGIPNGRLHTVLERYRYSAGLCEAENGPGFGLTAARVIARLHGGTLLLESREGMGTAVRVSLSRSARRAGLWSASEDYDKSYNTILTGLAPCLPPEAFDEPNR
jgi:signal transduction histidine kinase